MPGCRRTNLLPNIHQYEKYPVLIKLIGNATPFRHHIYHLQKIAEITDGKKGFLKDCK